MKTKFKFISCILMLLIIATTGVWAKETPVSPTNEATAGLASAEADQFMSVLEWGKVKFDKVFTYAGFKQGTEKSIDLGAAFKAGPLFIGAWYQGNISYLDGKSNKQVTTSVKENPEQQGTLKNVHTKTNGYIYNDSKGNNNAQVLFGFNNMGIKVGYSGSVDNSRGSMYTYDDSSWNSYMDNIAKDSSKPDSYTSTVYSPKGFYYNSNYAPSVLFGMKIPLGKMMLLPTASLKVDIMRKLAFGTKTEETSSDVHNKTTDKRSKAFNKSYIGINGKLGTGLNLGDALNSAFTFEYDFTVRAYGNKKYKALDGSTKKLNSEYNNLTDKIYTIKGNVYQLTSRNFQANFDKKTWFDNNLSFGYTIQKEFTDRFALLAGADLKLGFSIEKNISDRISEKNQRLEYTNKSNSGNNYTQTTRITNPIETVNKNTVTLTPSLKAAVTYTALPGRVFLNLGTSVNFLNYTHTDTKTTYNSFVKKEETTKIYDDGRTDHSVTITPVDKIESHEKTDIISETSINLKGGLRWNVVENFGFDIVYSNSLLLNQPIKLTELSKLTLACTIKF